MNAKEKIIAQIKNNKPAEKDLPTIPLFGDSKHNLEKFKEVLTSIGGKFVELSEDQIFFYIQSNFPKSYKIASNVIKGNFDIDSATLTDEIKQVDLAILKGAFGVAENAAIWLPEKNMMQRALPVITQHLVLVLSKSELLPTMHYAYRAIESIGGYGVFIAGPSKTADIEQSLVIGAHGARSLTVILLEN